MATTWAISSITETTTLGNYTMIFVDASSDDVTLTFPDADGIEGRVYYIKRVDTSGNEVSLQPAVDNYFQGSPSGFPMFFGEVYGFVAQSSNNWQIFSYTNQ